jgi:hypothetical protein
MSPKERAKERATEIVAAMFECADTYGEAKMCAIVAVDYMILAQRACYTKMANYYEQSDQYNHLIKVKKEIELL